MAFSPPYSLFNTKPASSEGGLYSKKSGQKIEIQQIGKPHIYSFFIKYYILKSSAVLND